MEILNDNKFETAAKNDGDKVNEISNSAVSEESWEVPNFSIPYKLHEPHPMSTRLCRESHEWLATHEVDKQLGPELWKLLVKHNTPDILSHILPNVGEKEFLLVCKLTLLFFAVDTVLDETPTGKDVEKSLDVILEIIPVLMWNYRDEPALLECVVHMYNLLVASETSKNSIEMIKARVIQATRNEECKFNLSPIASAWKDFWAEYLSYGLPHEYNVRLAQGLLEWLTSCFEEARYRSSKTTPGLKDYIAFRQKASAIKPSIVSIDVIIHLYTPGIPSSLFYSPPMQRLLLAVSDLMSWHNDVFSFYKECIVNKDTCNLVHIISQEQKCSYTEAAATFVRKMLKERIDDMESAITDFSLAASADVQPAVQMYAATCRNMVSGSHAWHSKSSRYKRAPLTS